MQTLIFSVKVTLLRHEADFAKDFAKDSAKDSAKDFAMDFRCTIATPLAENFVNLTKIFVKLTFFFFLREVLQ